VLFEGRNVLITGAGSGIGRATAELFAREGAAVTIAERDEPAGAEVAEAIRAAGGTAESLVVDVADEEQVAGAVKHVATLRGRLDVMVNNAGIGGSREDPFLWDPVINVNLNGVWYGCKHALQQMRSQGGGGAIVSIASIAGLTGGWGSAYTSSKHAVIGLTRNLALEAAPDGIRVNCVCPGYVRTAMTRLGWEDPEIMAMITPTVPLARMAEPREIAEAVAWLASDRASYVTGSALVVDGGFTAR
jgi:NAD(P)-dependent dehydrogenase (short-subunit alcohol dehydrogenase family)